MLRSEDRILTTHAGSLPRSQRLVELMIARSRDEDVDVAELEAEIEASTTAVFQRQADVGIDIACNGEQARESFFSYVRWRMTGFDGESRSRRKLMADMTAYPDYLDQRARLFGGQTVSLMRAPAASGPITYIGQPELFAEIDQAVRLGGAHDFAELFFTAPSPGIIAAAMDNQHYPDQDAYLDALAAALSVEYRSITDAGMVLQIDAPDVAMERHCSFADEPFDEFIGFVDRVIDTINTALTGVDRDQVRFHVCWGNYEGPHDQDVPLDAILDSILRIDAGALVLSMANPRHAHEHIVLARADLPHDLLIVAGVIDSTTNYVEHPEVVAQRIVQVADVLGDPTRVIAGTDCGFGTAAGLADVAADVVWPKLRALRDGADLASARLFG